VLNAIPTTGGTISGNLVVTGTETVSTITSPAATALTLQTNNGTTALNLTSAGRMTLPNQITVSAGLTSGTVTGPAIAVFNSVSINIGSAYNSSTGIFTAPVAGRYLVGANCTANLTNTLLIQIRVNSTSQYTAQSSNSAGAQSYQVISLSQILSLSVNDTVDIYVPSSSSMYGGSAAFTNMYIALIG
jgi:hypothetical protein